MTIIDPKDVYVEVTPSGGWFKSVSTIKLIHLPTGISVTEGSTRSQHMNKGKAFVRLLQIFQTLNPKVKTK